MKFDDVVEAIGTLTDLRRIAGAHVVDHKQLRDEELKSAVKKVKPQYLHEETVRANLERSLYRGQRTDYRVLSRLILVDVLLDQYDFMLPFPQTEEKVISFEQTILNRSNETDIIDLACSDKNSKRYHNLELYNFVLRVAWENENTKSPDEVNLLRKLRDRLNITEADHQILEAKLGKYPKPSNELHNRTEIGEVRRYLQGKGLLFAIRLDGNNDIDVIPKELASVLKSILGKELRKESYEEIFKYKSLRKKVHLINVLDRCGIEYGRNETIEKLIKRIIEYVPPSKAIACSSPRYGLNSEQLGSWCRELNLPQSGTIEERVARIISHFDQLRPNIEVGPDERKHWYVFFKELASRNYETLRAQHIIDKDLEIERKFEEATKFLFSEKLKHTPLKQQGTNHPDGLLSLQSNSF